MQGLFGLKNMQGLLILHYTGSGISREGTTILKLQINDISPNKGRHTTGGDLI